MRSRRFLTMLAALCMVTTAPGHAADTPSTVGIAAGLGLTAAGGKSTVSNGGGAVEAAVLNTEGLLVAGAEIRRLAAAVAGSRPVLVLGHGDTLDVSHARYVEWMLSNIEKYQSLTCPKAPASAARRPRHGGNAGHAGGARDEDYAANVTVPLFNTPAGKVTLSPADIAPALMTDIDVQGITLSTDDRMLVDAVLMGTEDGTGTPVSAAWYLPGAITQHTLELEADGASGAPHQFRAPSDVLDLQVAGAHKNELLTRFDAIADWGRTNAACKPLKNRVAEVTAFTTAVTAADKDTPPAIIAASEIETLLTGDPDILRVAVEQNAGTAVTRTNIWYSLGYPGAVQISTGLVVSFRLTDPKAGDPLLTGFVRCMARPTNIRRVKRIVEAGYDPQEAKQRADREDTDADAELRAAQKGAPAPPPLQHVIAEERARQLVTCSVSAYPAAN